jgi:hypothetical protein
LCGAKLPYKFNYNGKINKVVLIKCDKKEGFEPCDVHLTYDMAEGHIMSELAGVDVKHKTTFDQGAESYFIALTNVFGQEKTKKKYGGNNNKDRMRYYLKQVNDSDTVSKAISNIINPCVDWYVANDLEYEKITEIFADEKDADEKHAEKVKNSDETITSTILSRDELIEIYTKIRINDTNLPELESMKRCFVEGKYIIIKLGGRFLTALKDKQKEQKEQDEQMKQKEQKKQDEQIKQKEPETDGTETDGTETKGTETKEQEQKQKDQNQKQNN